MVESSERLKTLDELRQYVVETLSCLESLQPERVELTQETLSRAGTPCGIQFCLHGPRAVRLTAIWETDRNTILFYGSCGRRVQRTRLVEAPKFVAPTIEA